MSKNVNVLKYFWHERKFLWHKKGLHFLLSMLDYHKELSSQKNPKIRPLITMYLNHLNS